MFERENRIIPTFVRYFGKSLCEVALREVAKSLRQHQVICWRCCRHSVVIARYDMHTLRFRVHASQQCVRDEHTQRRYNRSLVDRESRWSAHRWPSELNAHCAIEMRYRRSASSFPSPCSLLPRYSKLGTFSSVLIL